MTDFGAKPLFPKRIPKIVENLLKFGVLIEN